MTFAPLKVACKSASDPGPPTVSPPAKVAAPVRDRVSPEKMMMVDEVSETVPP
jgi:hypothetical protein